MSVNRFIIVFFALVALVTPTLAYHPISAQAATPASPGSIITWNGIARRTAIQVAGQTTAHAMTSIAFTQAAVYDAVVAIEGGYQPYQVRLAQLPDASLDAAVATAAHHVLAHYFPTQQAALDTDYATALAAVPDGTAKAAGIMVGQATATGLIARRQSDGLEADIGFTMPAAGPGVWQLPEGQNPMTPWASKLRPFLLRSPDQFRPGSPSALSSRAWATDFNEVKAIGRLDSPSRAKVCPGEIHVRLEQVRPDGESALARRHRVLEPAERQQQRARLVLKFRGGLERGGSLVGRQRPFDQRFLEPPHGCVDVLGRQRAIGRELVQDLRWDRLHRRIVVLSFASGHR